MHWGNVLTWIKARPLSNWVAAIAVIVIVIGSFFGLWQIEWRQFLATYIPISRPPPEIVALAPDHGPQGTEVSLSGRRLDGFGIRESYVKIGPFEVARARLSPHEDAILFTVASQSSPGRYAIELVIDGKRAKEEKSFKVTLLNDDQLEAVRIGQKRIILVAPFGSKEEGNEEEGRRKQDDIVEQIERSFGSTPVLRDTIIVAKWPQEISGPDKDNFALQLVKENNAELLVYGTLTDENISARVAVANAVHLDRPVEIIPVVSKHTLDKDIPALGAQTQRNFDLSPEPVTRPVKLMYFLQGWHFMADSKFAAARDAFLEVSKFPNLDVVDLASFRYAAGRASLFAASDIGEQPQRTPYDYQQMDVYLAEAKESLLAAEQAYAKQHKLKEQGETLIELALLSTLERQESPAEQHMESARFLERAVSNLNCENDQDDCFRAYTNLAADYDWMGTEAWSRSNHDDLLLKAEKSKFGSGEPDRWPGCGL